jgi:uncharacterized repeat protein (TIGR01451 family)
MKRFVIRLSVVSVVALLGLIAIAQAQRSKSDTETEVPPASTAVGNTSDLLKQAATNLPDVAPTAKAAEPTGTAAPDPFSQARLPAAANSDIPGDAANSLDSARRSGPPSMLTSTPVQPTSGDRYGNYDPRARYSNDRYGADATDAGPSEATTESSTASDPPGALAGDSQYPTANSIRSAAVDHEMPNALSNSPSNPLSNPLRSNTAIDAPPGSSMPSANPLSGGRSMTMQESAIASEAAASSRLRLQTGRDAGTAASEPAGSSEYQAAPSSRFANSDPVRGSIRQPASEEPGANASRFPEPAALRTGSTNPLRQLQPPAAGDLSERGGSALQSPAGAAIGDEGTGRPGQQQLDGVQSPSLTIEKFAPAEVQIGKPAVFEVLVRNVGKVRAQNVTVHDQVPKKTRLLGTTPQAQRSPEGDLVWNLGTLEPGAEQTVQLELMPTDEGEIGSVATVHFAAHSSVRTVATRPELQLEVSTSKEVMIGGELALTIKISNPGTGPATGIVLKEVVPDNFTHPGGSELEYEVGDLKPKETRELELVLKAAKAGVGTNVLTARGDGSLQARSQSELEVIAPSLAIEMSGPKRRFLEREATYTVSISNPGTAAARDVELVTYLPQGFDFVRADNYGEWDAQTRAVRWSLEELPPSETGSVSLTTMPVAAGEHKLLIEGSAGQGLSARQEQSVLVEGVAAILFQVIDVEDPIEVKGETTYEIRVVNQGSKAATDVELQAVLDPQMKALSADGPTQHAIDRGIVRFDKLPRLAPKADTTYRIRVQGLNAGDLRMRVQVVTNEITTPIVKEESTRVYADE